MFTLINKLLLCLLMSLLVTACGVTPKRGDAAYAPAIPAYYPAPVYNTDSIYQSNSGWLLHEDIKARRIGDMLTVILEEETDAAKTAETGIAKDTSASLSGTAILGNTVTRDGANMLDTTITSANSFDGSGESKQSNSLKGSVTVTVVDVLANGNLLVQGEKWIHINQGEEFVRLKGIVRTMDIRPDNTISSERIADAQIQYSGDSTLNDANEMGWLAKFFNSSWMPF